jgi:hypothetical protein
MLLSGHDRGEEFFSVPGKAKGGIGHQSVQFLRGEPLAPSIGGLYYL